MGKVFFNKATMKLRQPNNLLVGALSENREFRMPQCKSAIMRRPGFLLTIWSTCLLSLSLTCWSGCGPRSDRPPTAPVTGKVTLDGKPLPSGWVYFDPADGRRLAKGQIQPDGSFSLGTFEENDGAVLGRHRVMVVARKEVEGGKDLLEPKVGPSLIPEYYGDIGTSPLTFEVAPGDNIANFELYTRVNSSR